MSLSCLVFITDCTSLIVYDYSILFFCIDYTLTINHVIVLSCFRQISHLVRSVIVAQFCFRHRPHLYDQSRHCYLWFSSQLPHGLIGHDNSALLFDVDPTYTIDHVVVLSGFRHRLHLV